jgi:hypothetical protein
VKKLAREVRRSHREGPRLVRRDAHVQMRFMRLPKPQVKRGEYPA